MKIEFDDKVMALAELLKVEPSLVSQVGGEFEVDGDKDQASYKVLTDDEADEAWEDSLDNYIEDVIMPEIAEPYQMYFNEEAWRRDARINSYRGQELSHYDGSEEEIEVNGTTYYIYRTN